QFQTDFQKKYRRMSLWARLSRFKRQKELSFIVSALRIRKRRVRGRRENLPLHGVSIARERNSAYAQCIDGIARVRLAGVAGRRFPEKTGKTEETEKHFWRDNSQQKV